MTAFSTHEVAKTLGLPESKIRSCARTALLGPACGPGGSGSARPRRAPSTDTPCSWRRCQRARGGAGAGTGTLSVAPGPALAPGGRECSPSAA